MTAEGGLPGSQAARAGALAAEGLTAEAPGERPLAYGLVAIPGDGVGPDVVAAAKRVLAAAGARFGFGVDWTDLVVGGAGIDAYGVAIRDEDLAACAASDAILLGAVGGPKWDDPTSVGPSRAGALRHARRPGPLRQPAPGQRPPGPRAGLAAPARAARGRRHADRPRADRRPLLRLAHGGHRGARRPIRQRHPAVLGGRGRPRRPPRLRPGARPPEAADQRRQGERPGDVAPVADGRPRDRPGVPGRRPRRPARRRLRDADRAGAGVLRRPRDREPLRRHPVRRGIGAGREPGHAALGLGGDAAHGARPARPLRADPRLRARHRRAGPGEPGRDDPLRRHAPALVAGPRRRRRRGGGGRLGRAGRRLPDAGPVAARPRGRRALHPRGDRRDGRRDRRPDRQRTPPPADDLDAATIVATSQLLGLL